MGQRRGLSSACAVASSDDDCQTLEPPAIGTCGLGGRKAATGHLPLRGKRTVATLATSRHIGTAGRRSVRCQREMVTLHCPRCGLVDCRLRIFALIFGGLPESIFGRRTHSHTTHTTHTPPAAAQTNRPITINDTIGGRVRHLLTPADQSWCVLALRLCVGYPAILPASPRGGRKPNHHRRQEGEKLYRG